MRHEYDPLNDFEDISLYPSQQEIDDVFSNFEGAESENQIRLPLDLQEENIRSIPTLTRTDPTLLTYEELFAVLRNPEGSKRKKQDELINCNHRSSPHGSHSLIKETNLRRPVSSDTPERVHFPLYPSLYRSTSELTFSLRKNSKSISSPKLPTIRNTRRSESGDLQSSSNYKTESSKELKYFNGVSFESSTEMDPPELKTFLHRFLLDNLICRREDGHITQEPLEENGGNAPHRLNKVEKYDQQPNNEVQSSFDKVFPKHQVSFSLTINGERMKNSKQTRTGNEINVKLNEKLKGENNVNSKINSNANGKKALLISNKKSNGSKLSNKMNKKIIRCLGCARRLRIREHVELICCPVCRVITPSRYNEIVPDSSLKIIE